MLSDDLKGRVLEAAPKRSHPGPHSRAWQGRAEAGRAGRAPWVPEPSQPRPLGPEPRPSPPRLPLQPPGRAAPASEEPSPSRREPCRPATPRTHRPSSHSTGFALQLRPQHPTLPAPPLTHFPAEPAPSITPAPPPPPPPQAGPKRPWAEGPCGTCRNTGGEGARAGGEHAWRRARNCGECSSLRRKNSEHQ